MFFGCFTLLDLVYHAEPLPTRPVIAKPLIRTAVKEVLIGQLGSSFNAVNEQQIFVKELS